MKWYEQREPFYRQKKWIIPLALLLFLIVLRAIMPPVLLSFINSKLKDHDLSPTLQGHVGSLDLGILRGRILLRDITAEIKDSSKRFLSIASVEAGISMHDLFKGDLVADVVIKGADFTYSNSLMKALKIHAEETKKEEKKGPPVHIARVDIKDAKMRLEPDDALTKKDDVLMSDIDGRITNATPTKKLPKTLMAVQGKLLDSGIVKTVGEAKLLEHPAKWSVDSEVIRFDLSTLNRFLLNKAPISFTHGRLDLFAEAQSEGGKIRGYIKPFVNKLDVVKKEENFKGPKHFLLEIITAIGNMAIASGEEESATKVPFVFDGQLKAETGEALINAFGHAFNQEISKGIENSLKLK